MENDAELLAAFDAKTGDFVDLVMSDRSGLSFRSPVQTWEGYQPADRSLDGAEILDVDESFVAVVDRAYAGGGRPSRVQAAGHAPNDGNAE